MGHNYNDSINFSFKKDLETIKSLPKEKRWKYIWDYYKIIILVLPVALIVLLILGSFCVNMVKGTFFPKDPVSIGIAVSGYSRPRTGYRAARRPSAAIRSGNICKFWSPRPTVPNGTIL